MGTIGSTIDSLSASSSSAFQAEITGFTNRSTSLGDQITAMNARTAAYQTLLTNEFTQMNVTWPSTSKWALRSLRPRVAFEQQQR